MPSAQRKRIAIAVSLAATLACSGDNTTGPTPTPTPAVTTVTLARDTATVVPGASVKLVATAAGSAGQALDRTISWLSSDTTKATVGTDGTVIGVSTGSAVITATAESITGHATITILDGGLISANGATVRAAGGEVTLVAPVNAVTENTSVVV